MKTGKAETMMNSYQATTIHVLNPKRSESPNTIFSHFHSKDTTANKPVAAERSKVQRIPSNAENGILQSGVYC